MPATPPACGGCWPKKATRARGTVRPGRLRAQQATQEGRRRLGSGTGPRFPLPLPRIQGGRTEPHGLPATREGAQPLGSSLARPLLGSPPPTGEPGGRTACKLASLLARLLACLFACWLALFLQIFKFPFANLGGGVPVQDRRMRLQNPRNLFSKGLKVSFLGGGGGRRGAPISPRTCRLVCSPVGSPFANAPISFGKSQRGLGGGCPPRRVRLLNPARNLFLKGAQAFF